MTIREEFAGKNCKTPGKIRQFRLKVPVINMIPGIKCEEEDHCAPVDRSQEVVPFIMITFTLPLSRPFSETLHRILL